MKVRTFGFVCLYNNKPVDWVCFIGDGNIFFWETQVEMSMALKSLGRGLSFPRYYLILPYDGGTLVDQHFSKIGFGAEALKEELIDLLPETMKIESLKMDFTLLG